MKEVQEILENVTDEKTFLKFVHALIADREPHEGKSIDGVGFTEDWANNTIFQFLEGAVSWAEDSEFGVTQDPCLAQNNWKQFAVFLYCGKVYE